MKGKDNPLSPPCIPPNPGFRDLPAKSKFLAVMLLKAPIHIYRDPGIEGPIPTTNEVKESGSFGHSPNWTESPLKARPCSNTTISFLSA